MCLRLVASLAALAVAQQEPESYVRPSSMNLDAYKKAKDEAAMLRLLLGNPNAGDAAYYSKLVDIAADLKQGMVEKKAKKGKEETPRADAALDTPDKPDTTQTL